MEPLHFGRQTAHTEISRVVHGSGFGHFAEVGLT